MPKSKVEKKVAVKKVAVKKVAVKKVAVKKVAVKKTPVVKKSKVQLVSFSVTAIIPTQQYGNIQPTITVTAPSIEEAREVVMPALESIYLTYCESQPRGKAFAFTPKITEETRIIEKAVTAVPAVVPTPVAVPVSAPAPAVAPAPVVAPVATPAPVAVPAPEPVAERSEPFKKAERAISLAQGHDALNIIQAQIEKSIKIDPADKPELIISITNRKNDLPF